MVVGGGGGGGGGEHPHILAGMQLNCFKQLFAWQKDYFIKVMDKGRKNGCLVLFFLLLLFVFFCPKRHNKFIHYTQENSMLISSEFGQLVLVSSCMNAFVIIIDS